MKVPDRLRDRVGRQEICMSLQTYSPSDARILAASVTSQVQELFTMLDKNANLTTQEVRNLVQARFAAILSEIDTHRVLQQETRYPDMELEDQTSLANGEIAGLTGELMSKAFSRSTIREAEAVLANKGIGLSISLPIRKAR